MTYLLSDALHTGFVATAGFALALLIAILLAALVVLVPLLQKPVYAMGVFWKVSPAVAYGGLLYLLLGEALYAKIVTAAIICFYPLLVELIEALNRLPERLSEQAKLRNCSRLSMVRAFGWAYMLEGVTRAMLTAGPLAVIGAIVADYVIAGTRPSGIGQKILSASVSMNTSAQIDAVIMSTILGTTSFLIAKVVHVFVMRRLLLNKG